MEGMLIMRKITFAVFGIILAIATVVNADDAGEIKSVFRQYVEAAINSDGELVAEVFSDSASDYWTRMLKYASTLSRTELEKRPTYQLLNIILIRKRIEDDPRIAEMDGKKFLQHSYSEGWNSTSALKYLNDNREKYELVPEMTGESAELIIIYEGEALPVGLPFIKEGGRWKIDGKKQFELLEGNIEAKRKLSSLSKTEFAELLFERIFNVSVPDSLWYPIDN